ncbi:MAG: PAS domain S-box protein [Rhodocyclaceae bacterium]|nr:PAS domain S-box protein [Rhodocyclaceae bacterium]
MNFIRKLSRRGLSAYLALAFSVLTIWLTLVLVAGVEKIGSQQVKASIGHGLAELALQTSDKLDRGMFERYREIQLLAKRDDLIRHGLAPQARRQILEDRQATYPYYAWIGMTDPSGKVLVATQGLLEGTDVSRRPWFANVKENIHLSDVHETRTLAGLLPTDNGEPLRFVDVAFPYMDEFGRPAGVLGVHLYWRWATDADQSIIAPLAARRHVESMIVNTLGTVLLGPPALQGKTLSQASLQAAQKDGTGYLVEEWPDGHTYVVGYSKSVGYQSYPGLGWTVLVRQRLDDAYAPIRQMRSQSLWIGLGMAVLFSLFGIIVAQRITRPLKQLALASEQIERGTAGKIPDLSDSYAEVRILSCALNSLLGKLVKRKEELGELNASLEWRVDERTRALESALSTVQADERRIASIIEASQDAFIGVDLEGRIVDWSLRAEQMFGWSRAEALGQMLADLVLPEPSRPAFSETLLDFRTGTLELMQRRGERLALDRQGREFPVEVTAGLAGFGDAVFFSLFLHDISERKKVEQMKSEFISTVSHELRTPLSAIRASLSLLVDDVAAPLPADARELIGIAHQSCERLARLVDEVLDVQKIEAGSMRYRFQRQYLLPIAMHAAEVMQSYAQQLGITLVCRAHEGEAAVMADADRLHQVLTNLISNAIKFSPPGGAVEIDISRHEGHVRLSVRDHGRGIPDDFRPRIFQRFAQADSGDSRDKGGTGLGLNICKSIVEAHGGTIGFDSVLGQGTVFHVDLPPA